MSTRLRIGWKYAHESLEEYSELRTVLLTMTVYAEQATIMSFIHSMTKLDYPKTLHTRIFLTRTRVLTHPTHTMVRT